MFFIWKKHVKYVFSNTGYRTATFRQICWFSSSDSISTLWLMLTLLLFVWQGFSSKREFIATQGPLPSTRDDFWRMVWEFNCRAVVMLTKCVEAGKLKCDQYWPSDMEPVFYGDLQVTVLNEDSTRSTWTIRELQISMVHAFCQIYWFLSRLDFFSVYHEQENMSTNSRIVRRRMK